MLGGDLEESVFQRNVPGKFSRWDRGEDEGNRNDSDVGVDYDNDAGDDHNNISADNFRGTGDRVTTDKLLSDKSIPDHIKNGILNERSQKHNTGVKGVLADRKAHAALERAQREAKTQERNAILTRMVQGAKVSSSPSVQQQEPPNVDDEEDEDDDEFFAAFRAKRLQEIKASSALPTFGEVKDVSSSDFVEQVEKVDSRVWVIVHLFEPAISTCVRLNRILEEIAMNMRNVKFLRMQCSTNGIDIDRVAMPMMQLYRGGENVQTIAGITVELGDFFKKEEIEWLLDSHLSSNQ
jgi:hypothetical protein